MTLDSAQMRDGCSFPSCRCEWSNRREHCPRYGGTTKGYEDTPEPPEPWGNKLTISVYIKGPLTGDDMRGHIAAINAAFPHAEFIGLHHDAVLTEPKDQGAS